MGKASREGLARTIMFPYRSDLRRVGIGMTRQAEWQAEVRDALLPEDWSLTGVRRLIKVVRMGTVMNRPATVRACGYVTQEKYILGKTPAEIERALGLPPFSLGTGCRVFRLQYLPARSQYSYELSTAEPDGRAFNPADAWEARVVYWNKAGLTEVPYYPPGSSRIPQWKVMVDIPIIHVTDLPPNFNYRSV